ncbi:MAG: Nif3-like dinuclear metal center hexameric protein [Opitutales bacterium]|nr:Nif3-like dinuclear metal center hexameric protein [Opitutales bacterium]
MASLDEIVDYCQKRLNVASIRDFKGSCNGLQVGNSGQVSRIGAIVDAGLFPFREAANRHMDLLICHHGLFWDTPLPVVGLAREKFKTLLDGNIALYSCHLPLDAHQELGNNAQIAQKLGLEVERWGLEYEGVPMAPVCKFGNSLGSLEERLESLFPRITRIAFGSKKPKRLCIVSGSGSQTLPELAALGVDTLITGELKQASFNVAQELGLNVFACGHYDTEVFGVRALAAELSERFKLPWEFIPTGCPL